MKQRILFVDDEDMVLQGLRRMLRPLREQWDMEFVESAAKALELMALQPFDVVVADMQTPGMNGVQFLTRIEQTAPDTVRLMLTGNADQETAVDAVNEGHVFRFLTKPCAPEALARALEAGIKQYRLVTAERELLENTLNGSVKLLTDTLSMTDPAAFGRAWQIRDQMRQVASHFNITQTWNLELAAMLSPIGYLAMPAAVLQRSRDGLALTGAEKDMLARVPETGAKLLANIPRLETVAQIVRYQQKNFDGTGQPSDDIAGEDLPIGARILKVLNDLLTVEARNVPRYKALESLRRSAGRYDPKVLEAVAVSFDPALGPEAADRPAPRNLGLKELQIGHHIAAGIQTRDGILIVPMGTIIAQVHLEKLRNFAELSGIREPILIAA